MGITKGPWKLELPDASHPHSVCIRIPEGNWTVRATEPNSGAKRGESPQWYGWTNELDTARAIACLPELVEELQDFVTYYQTHGPARFGNGKASQHFYTAAHALLRALEGE